MTDVVVAFDNMGRPRDELPVVVPRGWEITRSVNSAKGFFNILATHQKANINNLKNGNIIYVYSDQRGIKPWAAIICEPEPSGTEIIDGELNIKLRSSEWILGTRYTGPQDILTGKPGEVLAQLLYIARREGYMPISTDLSGVDMGGETVGPLEYNDANIYQAINDLAEKCDAYWWLYPTIDNTNTLVLKVNWAFKRSRSFNVPLKSAGSSSNFVISNINQAAEIANHVKAFARTDDWSKPVEYEETNPRSVSYYGRVFTLVIPALEETTSAGLIPIVQTALKNLSFPPLHIDGTITSAPFPQAGDTLYVLLSNYGSLITARRGAIVQMYVETAFYSPQDNGLTVHLVEIIN